MNNLTDGFYNGVITAVRPVELRFKREGEAVNGFELEFKVGVYDANNQPAATVEIYEEFSTRYGVGAFSAMTQAQIALENLRKLGYQAGQDLSQLQTLVSKPCRVRVVTKDKQGQPLKGGPRFYFAFGAEVKPLTGDLNAALKSIMSSVGGAAPAPGGAAFNFPNAAPTPQPQQPNVANAAPIPGFPA